MRNLRAQVRVAGRAVLLVAVWLVVGGSVRGEPLSGMGVRLFVDCRGDLEAERYVHDVLAREFSKVEDVVLVGDRELAGLYVYGTRSVAQPVESRGYVLSIAHTTRLSAELILGAFSATEPSEQQLGMVAEMADGASYLEHLDSVYLEDLFVFEPQGVAAAVVRDFERRALEPIREILHEMSQVVRPSEEDAGPAQPRGLVREVSADPGGGVFQAREAAERGERSAPRGLPARAVVL